MENKVIKVLVIAHEGVLSRASDLIYSLGKKVGFIVKVDGVSTIELAIEKIMKTKYQKTIWMCIEKDNLNKISPTIFEEGSERLVI